MDGVTHYKLKRQRKENEDKKDEIIRLTDEIVEMRNSFEIVKHPDFISWYKVNVGNKLEDELKVLKKTKDHFDMLRAQGAVGILEGFSHWHENISKQMEKHRNRIEKLQKDINHD